MTELSSLQLLPSLPKPIQTIQELDRKVGLWLFKLGSAFYETEMMLY